MKFEQSMMNYDKHAMILLEVDFDRLHLRFSGDPDCELDETFADSAAMNARYQREIVPYIEKHELYDIDGNQDAEVIDDLAEFPAELEARATAEPVPEGASDLDAAVIRFTNALRERLNRALGPEPLELSCVVISLGDSGITGATINGELLAGKTRPEIEAVLAAHPHGGWEGTDYRRQAGLDLEYSPLISPLSAYGDPNNLYDDLCQRLFYLAAARLERSPYLRPNVTVRPGLRVFWAIHDDTEIAWSWRETAERFVDEPAATYFAHTCGAP